MPCFSIVSEVEKILKKNQNGFQRNRLTPSQILANNHEAAQTRVDFFMIFDFKDVVNKTANGLPKETVTKKHESNGSLTRWWNQFLWRSRLSLTRRYIRTISIYNLPRLRSMNVNRSNERKWSHTKKKKAKQRQYFTETITD